MTRLLNGDCVRIMEQMPDNSVDAVITDPPYGIGIDYGATYDDTDDNWYDLMRLVVPQMRRVAKFVIMPSCAINRLQWWYSNFPPDWLLCWHKGSPGHNAKVGFNDWEPHIFWGSRIKQMHDYWSVPTRFEVDSHPCPKPIRWATWIVEKSTNPDNTILDPFMGSGTVGVACKQLGRDFIGIEINPLYFAAAEDRINSAQPPLF